MHLGTPALLAFCASHRDEESLVLATIIGTGGSTYRKTGAMMLISRDGEFEGMISGGCLEGDLLEHAAAVFESGRPALLTYDMSADDDLIWSLGIGCDGVIHLLLQRLNNARGLAAFRQVEKSHNSREPVLLAVVTSPGGSAELGALAVHDRAGAAAGDPGLKPLLAEAAADWPEWRCRSLRLDGSEVLLVNMPPRTRVLICGAGPDAVPVARAFCGLGWEVVIADHRAAFARADQFPPACSVLHTRPAGLQTSVDLDEFDAAVIMTHHLESDAEYLGQLCGRPLAYLGLLGPTARKDRLRDMSGCTDRVVYGPVGLDIGAELPESIALSIAAEVHAVLNGRDGHSLAEAGS
mgnify:CR=1 FL=1